MVLGLYFQNIFFSWEKPKKDQKLEWSSTVGINPILSEPQGPGTSKLDRRYLEHNKIDSNELQIRTNSQKGTGTKMAE